MTAIVSDPGTRAAVLTGVLLVGIVAHHRARSRWHALLAQSERARRVEHLTGVGNRLSFDEALDAREPGEMSAVALVDVNKLKGVNDRYGHAAGDRVLIHTATCLKKGVGTLGEVARIAGDEFAMLLYGSVETALQVLHTTMRLIAEPIEVEPGVHYTVGLSVGVASAGHGLPAAEVMRRADLALYAAKTTEVSVLAWTPEMSMPERDHLRRRNIRDRREDSAPS